MIIRNEGRRFLALTARKGEAMKHTPGKWEYDTTGNYYNASGVIRMNGVLIAKMVTQTTHKPGEVEANARLIAAAPILLSALKALREDYQKLREDYGLPYVQNTPEADAIAAIAAAEGRK